MCVWCDTLHLYTVYGRCTMVITVGIGTLYTQQLHACQGHCWGAVKSLALLPVQVSDTVEAALREADIDHDGSIGLAGKPCGINCAGYLPDTTPNCCTFHQVAPSLPTVHCFVADFEALMRQASAEDLDLFSPVGSDTSDD
jgi:hypothetical protein